MRKPITFHIDVDTLKVLDSYVLLPCCRSDLLNEIVSYMLTNPGTINHFVNKKLNEVKNMLESNVNHE
ncbi:MAG TPA: hypothetical protein VLE02_02415 [Nitrosarchaeum sp.]|nr:hypothetical protein [Nitrosarchaeum sp.]